MEANHAMCGRKQPAVYATGSRGECVFGSVIRQQSQADFAWTLCRPRDLLGKHKRLMVAVHMVRFAYNKPSRKRMETIAKSGAVNYY